jgi:adenylate kinase
MDAGELVPDRLMVDLVRDFLKRLAGDRGIAFDGFPRTVAQAEALARALGDVGRRVDAVLVLEAPDAVLVKRISGRRVSPGGRVYHVSNDPPRVDGVCDATGEPLINRDDDQPDTVRRRMEVYRQQTEPLIRFYEDSDARVIRVDGDRPVSDIQSAMRAALEEIGALDGVEPRGGHP